MAAVEQLIDVDAFEEFLARPENRRRLFELIDGRIVEKLPTEEHGYIAGKLSQHLNNWIDDGHAGRVGIEVRHRPARDFLNDRLPDVSFVLDDTRPIVTKGAVLSMPDLAVEIKSPSDTYEDMLNVAAYYLQNGCRLVWLFYPSRKTVEVVIAAERYTLTIDDMLTGGDVLPEFEVPLSRVFRK